MASSFAFREHLVREVVGGKGRVIETSHASTVGEALQTMLSRDILALPVSAPPGEWTGAGGSTVITSPDASAGSPTRQYIGMISMLDIMMHLSDHRKDIYWALNAPVTLVIGQSIEGLSLWVVTPTTSVHEVMKLFSKGIHRVLVPMDKKPSIAGMKGAKDGDTPSVESPSKLAAAQHISPGRKTHNIVPVCDEEARISADHNEDSGGGSASFPAFTFCSQTDILRFLLEHSEEVAAVLSCSLESLGLRQRSVFAVPSDMRVSEAIQCMRQAALSGIAVVEAAEDIKDPGMLIQGRGRKLVGSLSATDLRGCNANVLKALPLLTVDEYLTRMALAKTLGIDRVFELRILGGSDEGLKSPNDEKKSCKPSQCFVDEQLLRLITQETGLSHPPENIQGVPQENKQEEEEEEEEGPVTSFPPCPPLESLKGHAKIADVRPSVTCLKTSTLGTVMAQALANRVHRVWVVDEDNLLQGLMSLSDMICCVREYIDAADSPGIASGRL